MLIVMPKAIKAHLHNLRVKNNYEPFTDAVHKLLLATDERATKKNTEFTSTNYVSLS